jgi:hypothetical protein
MRIAAPTQRFRRSINLKGRRRSANASGLASTATAFFAQTGHPPELLGRCSTSVKADGERQPINSSAANTVMTGTITPALTDEAAHENALCDTADNFRHVDINNQIE